MNNEATIMIFNNFINLILVGVEVTKASKSYTFLQLLEIRVDSDSAKESYHRILIRGFSS